MLKALNAWSVPAAVPFETMFADVAAAGFDAIELNLDGSGASAHALTEQTDAATFAHLRTLIRTYQLPVCSISTSLYGQGALGDPNPAVRRKGQDILRRQLACAAELGADAILVVPGGVAPDMPWQAAHEQAIATLAELVPEITASGIRAGLENVWNGFFLSPADLCGMIDRLGSPAIGAYFDVGNVAVCSYPEHWISALGSRIIRIHVKDFKRTPSWYRGHFVNLFEGDIDWQSVMTTLRQTGYNGPITAELSAMPRQPDYLYRITAEALSRMIT